jgi:hypothetical protein
VAAARCRAGGRSDRRPRLRLEATYRGLCRCRARLPCRDRLYDPGESRRRAGCSAADCSGSTPRASASKAWRESVSWRSSFLTWGQPASPVSLARPGQGVWTLRAPPESHAPSSHASDERVSSRDAWNGSRWSEPAATRSACSEQGPKQVAVTTPRSKSEPEELPAS